MRKAKSGDILDRNMGIPTVTNDEEYGILKHLITQHNEWHPQVWCHGCDLLFAQKNKKVEHKKLCGNKLKPCECTVENCGQKYRSKWWLKNHMATKHPKTDQDVVHHVCCKCGTGKQALKHMKRHVMHLHPKNKCYFQEFGIKIQHT